MLRFFRGVVILIGLTFSAGSAFAANWYVLKGATGSNNGTSWTNAWTEVGNINFSSVACGDTIWLGGGSYTTSLTTTKTCTSGSPITIESVLSTDSVPTAAAGYTSAVLNQVILLNNGIDFASGAYVTVNGRQGNATTGVKFGIVSQCTLSGGGCTGVTGAENGNITGMTLTYVEVYGPSCVVTPNPDAGSCSGNADGINIAPSNNTVNNLLLDHVYVHQWAETIRCSNWSNSTIQYSWISNTGFTNVEHEDVIYSYPNVNFTMRYNKIWGSPNDGVWFDDGGGVNLEFYGNVEYHSGGWLLGFPRCTPTCGPVFIYNNTFVNDGTFGDYQPGFIGPSGSLSSGSQIENNIFYEVDNQFSPTGSAYNAYFDSGYKETGSFQFSVGSSMSSYAGFVNMSASNPIVADYHLTAAGATTFQGGTSLPAPYNQDMDGNTRGANGIWYMGAYQYTTGTQTQAPQPPTGLTVTVQ